MKHASFYTCPSLCNASMYPITLVRPTPPRYILAPMKNIYAPLGTAEVADLLWVAPRTVLKWIRENKDGLGDIAEKKGCCYKFPTDKFDLWFEEHLANNSFHVKDRAIVNQRAYLLRYVLKHCVHEPCPLFTALRVKLPEAATLAGDP